MKKIMYILYFVISFSFCVNVNASSGVTVESITPIYDEESSIIVNEKDGRYEAIFNDKDQIVKYKVVLKNITNNEIHLNKVELSEPSEDFLEYTFDINSSNDYFKSGETKEIVLSLKTIDIAGWGRNFDDELTATLNFEESPVNPNTSTSKMLIICLVILTSGTLVVIFRKNKVTKYVVLALAVGSSLTMIHAKETITLTIKTEVSYESQNVSIAQAYSLEEVCQQDDCWLGKKYHLFWEHSFSIIDIYIENEIRDIQNYEYKYDVSEKQNGKVFAYLVINDNEKVCYNDNAEEVPCYDLYLQSDGILYLNSNSSYFFSNMFYLNSINNIKGLDTSNVTNMEGMFFYSAVNSASLNLDLSKFDTSNVTNMSKMFNFTCNNCENFNLNLSSFDTGKVTDMSYMFSYAGERCNDLNLDLSNFDTSNVTNMEGMFEWTGGSASNVTIDVSSFDTSKVTNMSYMFFTTGSDLLDVSNFDTSNVVYMDSMFGFTGRNSDKFKTSITIRNPNTSEFYWMFEHAATFPGSQIIVNYTSETSDLVDQMIATKSEYSNVVKGVQVD